MGVARTMLSRGSTAATAPSYLVIVHPPHVGALMRAPGCRALRSTPVRAR
jgi:hypothetical protein